jgi:hypothetical protein
MNFIKRKFFHWKFNPAVVFFVIFYFLVHSPFLAAKVKIFAGNKENIKAGELLSSTGYLDIGDFLAASEITRNSVPLFKPVNGDKTLVVLWLKDKALIIDTVNRKLRQQINLPFIIDVYRPEGSDFFLVVNREDKDKGKKISRYDDGSPTPAWTVPYDMENKFNWGVGNVYETLPFPVRIRYLPEKKQLFFAGITFTGKGKNFAILNKILLLDAEKGRVVREHNYHYRRNVEKNLELLVDKESNRFDLVDFNNGEITMTAVYSDSELLEEKKRYDFADYDWFAPVKKPVGGKEWLGYEFHKRGWEFSALQTTKGLMISTRKFVDKVKPGVKISHWVMINPGTGKGEPVNPCPNSGFDMALLNISGKKWPVIVPQRAYSRGMTGAKSNIFWIIERDGSMKQFTIPAPPEENTWFYYDPYHSKKWCHDGEYLYYLHSDRQKIFKKVIKERTLFRVKIGGDKAEKIFTYGDKQEASYILSGNNGYMVLSGKFRNLLVQAPPGKEITGTVFPDGAGPGRDILQIIAVREYAKTWSGVTNAIYLHKQIPKTELPGNYRTFLFYNFRTGTIGTKGPFHANTLPTVWGRGEGFLDTRDIGLTPVRLKDKTAILTGIQIQENRALFYVPILRIPVAGDKFYIFVTRLNEKEAVLTVLTDLQTINFYKMMRPR